MVSVLFDCNMASFYCYMLVFLIKQTFILLYLALLQCVVLIKRKTTIFLFHFITKESYSKKLFLLRESTSLYHSLGTSIFEFIPAMLTFDHVQINRTLAALKTTITICNQHRKNFTFVESLGTMIGGVNNIIFYYYFLSFMQAL